MNIRRGFLALAAMILGVGFLGAFPQQAQAQTITCAPAYTHNPPDLWPDDGWTQYCGTATLTNGRTMNGSYSNIQGQARNEMRRAPNRNFGDLNGVQFFIFGNPNEYQLWTGQQGRTYVAPLGDDFAVTVFKAGTNIPDYSAVFMVNGNGVTNTNITYRTGQQVGRSVDYLMGYVKNGGILPPTLIKVSDLQPGWTSADFNSDWTTLNVKEPCKVGVTPGLFTGLTNSGGVYICDGTLGDGTQLVPAFLGQTNQQIMTGASWANIYQVNLNKDWETLNGLTACGSSGLYRGRKDAQDNYICTGASGTGNTLTATYTGLNNRQVLQLAWPKIFGKAETIFADQVSKRYGMGSDTVDNPRSGDYFFASRFECSQWLAGSLTNKGILPSAANPDQMPVGCTLPAMTTRCVKLFTGDGQFPSGNIFDCESTAANSQQVLTKLTHLGNLTSYTQIKNEMDESKANIFIFDTVIGYQNAFAGAGQFVPVGVGGAVAATYPNPNGQGIWYTIVFQDQYGFSPTSAEVAYTVTHELGHVFDDTHGAPSSTAQYDKSMQNDWLKLDYVDYSQGVAGQRNPCGTQALDSYPGPLLLTTDPNTGSAFCVGNVVAQSKYLGKTTSYILRDAYPQAFDMPRRQATNNVGPNAPNGYARPLSWSEWHAEAFAIRARASVVTVPAVEIWSQIVANGYFACTAGPKIIPNPESWAYQEYNYGAVPPAATEPCQTNLPTVPTPWVPIH